MTSHWNCPICDRRMTLHCQVPVARWARSCRWLQCLGCNLLRNIITGVACANREHQEAS